MAWLIAAYILGWGLTFGMMLWSAMHVDGVAKGVRLIFCAAAWPIVWVAVIVLALLPKPARKY